jgi:drug/metabolite transporter (DMT)-like permease
MQTSGAPYSSTTAWVLLVLTGLAWGLSFSLARIAAVGGIHPFGISFWEAALAGSLIAIAVVATGMRYGHTRQTLLLYFATGLLGMIIPSIGFFYAAAHISAGLLSISSAAVPILTFLASAVIGIEKFEQRRVAGLILGASSIILLVAPTESLPDPAQLPWVLLAFAASASYAALSIMLALWKPAGSATRASTGGMFCAASLMMAPLAAATNSLGVFQPPWTAISLSLLGLGVINAFAYAVFFRLVEQAGPVFTSQTGNLVTLFGVGWGILIFGDRHSIWVWLSFVTMMAALALVRPRRTAPSLAMTS